MNILILTRTNKDKTGAGRSNEPSVHVIAFDRSHQIKHSFQFRKRVIFDRPQYI
jgi:hypothetical protein